MSPAARTKTPKNTTSKKDKNNYSWVKEMRYGRTISIEFFKSNALMGLRYKTKTKMVEIKNLTKELELAESDKLHEKAAYMSLIRESEMKRMVSDKGLPLEFQEQPPYQLIDDNNQE